VTDISVVSLFARLLVAMAVVLGLMFLAARALRGKTGPLGARRGRVAPIEVLARQGLGRQASVTLVRSGGKVLLLGVTEASINLLTEVDPDLVDIDGPEADRTALPGDGPVGQTSWTWKAMIDAARERTVRRS
jgi:flagellar biogenesis protein FliO